MPSAAVKPAPEIVPAPQSSLARSQSDAPNSTNWLCDLGFVGEPLFFVNYLSPPDDAYYTLLRPGDCGACLGATGGLLEGVHVGLQFVAQCLQPISISVVGSTGDATCPVPDPSNVLCPPVSYTLYIPEGGYGVFGLTLPTMCFFAGDAFLEVKFTAAGVGCATTATQPRLAVLGSCSPCRSYNYYPGGGGEWCALALPGNPIMSGDLLQCIFAPLDASTGVGAAPGERVRAIPNPARREDLRFEVALDQSGPAALEILDVSGRRLAQQEVGGLGAGRHAVRLDSGLRPGIYWVRLVRAEGVTRGRPFILR